MPQNLRTQFLGIRAHADGNYRQESLFGKDYIVVPVTALVEGVLLGMAADGPELALAEEFGRFPAGWDGRPVVMSHPVKNGTPISANSPGVLADYHVGALYNTKLVGNQLQQEAWLDVSRLNELNDDSRTLLANLRANKAIEVSTGYFAQLEASEGDYNGKKYIAIQRNIVPDHLALLPEGVIGACNNNDGCGINVNQGGEAHKSPALFRINCADCGGTCHDAGQAPVVLTQPQEGAELQANTRKKQTDIKAYEEGGELQVMRELIANSFPDGMLARDAEDLVRRALRVVQGYSYIVGLTPNTVVYEQYNAVSGYYETYQRSYTVAADGTVTLGNDVQAVYLVTKIIPVAQGSSLTANTTTSEAANPEGVRPTDNKEGTMPDPKKPGETAQEPKTNATQTAEPKTHKMSNDAGELEVTLDANGQPTGFSFTPKKPAANAEAPKQPTFQELLANADPATREMIDSGVKMHKARKDSLVDKLLKSNKCKFTKEQLEANSIEHLENLAELAGLTEEPIANFSGRAAPVSANADNDAAPPAPMVFSFKDGKLIDADEEAAA